MNKCSKCGGAVGFDPQSKANVCLNCGNAVPVKYNYAFKKKPFDKNQPMEFDPLANETKTVKCKSCGANVLVSKLQLNSKCLYCGSETITQSKSKGLMYIDSVVPFTFGKADAVNKLKKQILRRFFADKKIFKNITENDVAGLYVNTFVFDLGTCSTYHGTLSYDKTVRDNNGATHTETVIQHVSGSIDKAFKNLTIEANSNLTQRELGQIMPFEYTSAVDFQQDFINGYVLEYQDKLFNECVATAEHIVRREIERDIMKKHGCTAVVSLDVDTAYTDRKYNYCLLPVYMFTSVYKEKRYKVLMNGQSGKLGSLPSSKLRIFLTILFASLFITGVLLLLLLL